MGTGYTEKILNGQIVTFEQFAILCIRAFGASLHMCDQTLDVEYKPSEVNNYYVSDLKKRKHELDNFLKMSDNEILKNEIETIEKEIVYYTKKLEETKTNRKKLKSILRSVKKWQPPTNEHFEFKNFMINQLEQTIKWDGECSYYYDVLNDLNNKKNKKVDVEDIKRVNIEILQDRIEYAENKLKDEIENVNKSNMWVETLLLSLLENKKNKKILR